jgi:hypothetical protein
LSSGYSGVSGYSGYGVKSSNPVVQKIQNPVFVFALSFKL